ncbi:hypothetical protein SAMN06265182_0617 [Persephonella hydrogeniphila]|uniref:Uncharacterized protein n=1 Tax=Persephonella hydrogeniphila TaxID=198703 RepID=A0A285NF33_9AQUI|nr:hypothetical protein [Persephonella hydrogeniphila]SNZ06261.1 hypothetical protein SAMN06265182_0617 [Persephonella hydrogeniphila]
MSKFRLKRTYPTELEITVTPQQIVSMFPIELQEHPYMGIINRIWRTEKEIFSVETLPSEFVEDLTAERKYLKVKDEKLMEILRNLSIFQIVLYYEDKEDVYQVEKI